jgi:hypothetical protein
MAAYYRPARTQKLLRGIQDVVRDPVALRLPLVGYPHDNSRHSRERHNSSTSPSRLPAYFFANYTAYMLLGKDDADVSG